MNQNIKKALKTYLENNDQESAYNLIRVMRNGIEVIGGITVKDLYNDTVSFNKLVRLAITC